MCIIIEVLRTNNCSLATCMHVLVAWHCNGAGLWSAHDSSGILANTRTIILCNIHLTARKSRCLILREFKSVHLLRFDKFPKCSVILASSPGHSHLQCVFQRATLKNWECPGDEASVTLKGSIATSYIWLLRACNSQISIKIRLTHLFIHEVYKFIPQTIYLF